MSQEELPVRTVASAQIHVAPIEDTIEHELSAFCPCEPVLDTDPTTDGTPCITYTHRVAGPDPDHYNDIFEEDPEDD